MLLKVYAPNVHLFAFHLKDRRLTDATASQDDQRLLWDKCNEILSQKFGVTKQLDIEEQEGYRIDLLKDKTTDNVGFHFDSTVFPDNTSLPITGVAYPIRIHDTYALGLNLRRPEFDDLEKKIKTKPVPLSFLKLLNPVGCLMPYQIGSSLGQTLLLTIWYTEEKQWLPWKSPQTQQELRKLADDCLRDFIPDTISYPKFNQAGELFGSPVFEYGIPSQTENYCHIIVWIFCCSATSENFINYYSNFINLFCYRNKVIGAYQRSRKIYHSILEEYQNIESYTDKIFLNIPIDKILSEEQLDEFKGYLKGIPKKHLEYSRLIRDLDHYRLTIEINARNYRRELRDIHSQLPENDLSFLESFFEEYCCLFQEQIQADLGYFGHGVGLLEKALTAIQGRVQIEQAELDRQSQKELRASEEKRDLEREANEANEKERDRKLQNTIEAVGAGIGTGLGAGEIVAASYALAAPEKHIQWWPSNSLPLHPFTISLFLSLLSGLGMGVLTWHAIRLIQRRPDPLLQALPDLLKNKPEFFSIEDLEHLSHTLAPLENDLPENADEILRKWCMARHNIWNELRRLSSNRKEVIRFLPFNLKQSARTINFVQQLRQQVEKTLKLRAPA